MMRLTRDAGGKVVGRKSSYDVLIVNGEGTMWGNGFGFRQKMGFLSEAVAAGKPAYLINTVWQDCSHDFDPVLRSLSGIIARDEKSRLALMQHGVTPTMGLDLAYFDPEPRLTWPPRNFRGGIVATDFWSDDRKRFREDVMGAVQIDMRSYSWGRLIASLRTAKCLLTSRHHAVYAACRARIPFITTEGSSHKVSGFLEMANAAIPMAKSPAEMPEMIDRLDEYRCEYERLFDWMDRQRPAFPEL